MDFCSGMWLDLHLILQGTWLTILISFLLHPRLIPEVYKIEAGESELSGDAGSQEQHFFLLGNSHGSLSESTADLMQELYLLLSSGELMVKDKEEPCSEESAAPVNDKQGNLLKTLKCSCLTGLFPWGWKPWGQGEVEKK